MLSWFLLCAGLAGGQEPVAPLASGLVRSVELEPLPGTWVQHFRLDHEGAGAGELPLGLMRYVAGPDREGGVHVELELQFLAEDLRLIHTELASSLSRRLVFREVRARSGRTLFLEGTRAGGLEGYELGGSEVVRHARASGELPLLLIESMRLGLAVPQEAAVLDPLSACFEPLELRLRQQDEERVFEARRADGSLRWRVRARGLELVEWRFQERGPSARSVPCEEFERLRAQCELDVRAAREAAASGRRARALGG